MQLVRQTLIFLFFAIETILGKYLKSSKKKSGLTGWNLGVHPTAWFPCFFYCSYMVAPTNAGSPPSEQVHFQPCLYITNLFEQFSFVFFPICALRIAPTQIRLRMI